MKKKGLKKRPTFGVKMVFNSQYYTNFPAKMMTSSPTLDGLLDLGPKSNFQ